MKRLLTSFACIGLMSSQAMATPVYHPPGTNLTFGSVSNGRTIMSDIANPAASAASMSKNDDTLRFGIFSSVGAGFEYGEADDLFDELDAAANDLSNSFANVTDPSDATLINARINDINNIISKIEEDGYGKAFLSLHAPLMPIVVSSDLLGGSMVFDFNFSGVVPPQNDKDHYSLRYAEFVVPLVKAVQEQQEMIKQLQEEVARLKGQLRE